MSKETPVSTNMPVLSVEKTIRTLSRSYCTVIGKGLQGSQIFDNFFALKFINTA